jgi:anti-sigma regulatory factor (Ser/Thr protein kinase)
MRGSSGDPPRRRCRVSPDGSGGGLFEVTASPAIEYADDPEGPVVRRVNQAFLDTFEITDGVADIPLSTTLASITTGGDDAALLDAVRDGADETLPCQCPTGTGPTAFRVRTIGTDGGGYLVFTETNGTERVDVLKYLTHSLRNPLEVATVHTEVMADTGTLEHLDTVQTAHERIEDIISDTMALAQQGAVVTETAAVDIGGVARDAWATVRTDDATVSIAAQRTVEADESRLRVLFENLFRNAVRHGTADGDITVTVELMADGFAVADSGCGIPADERDRVLDVGYSTAESGTGLGLAIVAEIAAGHGWDLTVTESADGGTRFEFTGTTEP